MNYRSGTIQFILVVAVFLATTSFYYQSLADPKESSEKSVKNHSTASCASCHNNFTGTDEAEKVSSNNEHCLSCHKVTDLMEDSNFHQNNTDRCLDCHSFHETTKITAAGKSFSFQYNNEQLQKNCLSCHNGPYSTALLNEGHQQAKDVYHRNSNLVLSMTLSENCLICHSANNSPVISGLNTNSETIRFNVHASHPMDVQPNTTSGKGNRAEISSMNCVSCHDLTNSGNLAQSDKNNYDYNSCLSCHEDKQFDAYLLAKQ